MLETSRATIPAVAVVAVRVVVWLLCASGCVILVVVVVWLLRGRCVIMVVVVQLQVVRLSLWCDKTCRRHIVTSLTV